jgi:competence protein ComEA
MDACLRQVEHAREGTQMKKSTIIAAFVALALPFGIAFATPIDINHADAQAIAKALSGVGQAKAEAIVAYRKAHGPFKNPDELAKVKGIGPATVEHNRADIRLGHKAGKR